MDDDNYVNPRALLKLLKAFPQALDAYIGRPSLNRPIHASEPRPHNRTVCSSLTPSYTGHHSLGQARFGVRARPGQTQPGEGARLGQGCGGVGRVFWVSDLALSLYVWAGGFVSDPLPPL